MSGHHRTFFRTIVAYAACLIGAVQLQADGPELPVRETRIRAGRAGTIVAVKRPTTTLRTAGDTPDYPHPRPRLAGFSPLVAVTTSDEAHPLGYDLEFEHDLESSYIGSPLNPYVSTHYVIGYADSGADANLTAGIAADTLGLDFNLGPHQIEITGVGGSAFADITLPVAFFAAGLSAVDATGALDYNQLVGHSNVSGLRLPAIECGEAEVVTAVVGIPFLAFYNTFINVDTPRAVTLDGLTYKSPDVQIQSPDPYDPLPPLAHRIPVDFADGLPRMTANYYPELVGFLDGPPFVPTMMSVAAGLFPTGGLFFTNILLIEGEPGPTNPALSVQVLVDTGAQTSILSQGVADNLSLPFEADFPVDVCGVGGLVENVPGYYIDYVKINAAGGALEFSKAPFVVIRDFPFDGVLGMNFFWNRNVIFEPRLGGDSSFHVSAPIPIAYGDTDVDFDVDHDDAAVFLACLTGASEPDDQLVTADCDHLDADQDGDVDLNDFAGFQACFSGTDLTADPTCGE